MKLTRQTITFPAGVVDDRPITHTLGAQRTALFRGYPAAIGTNDLATAIVSYSDQRTLPAWLLQ